MIDIDFLQYQGQLRRKQSEGKLYVFDPIRKKYLVQMPEEMVRQLVLLFLQQAKGFSKNRLAIEKTLKVNELTKRCDILAYGMDMQPFLLVECKAPQIPISQDTFRQVAIYNLPLRVPYLMVTNGIQAFCCKMDYANNGFSFLHEVPTYPGRLPNSFL